MSRLPLRAGLLGLAILAAATVPADAFKKVSIGKRTKDYMQGLCSGPGRTYVEGQGQYGCISNCGDSSQTSDACGINCSEQTNECYGWSPGTQRVTNPHQILGRPKFGGGLLENSFGSMQPNAPAPTGIPLPPRGAPSGTIN
jgi:hypothetical protein